MNGVVDRGSFHGMAARTFGRLIAAAAVLIPAAVLYGDHIVLTLFPAFSAVFEWMAGDFKLLSMTLDHQGADRVVRVTVMWKHVVTIGGHVINPDPLGTATASTLMAHALQGPLVALLLACAWPAATEHRRHARAEYLARTCLLPPLLLGLGCFDLPVMLAGELWQLVFDALEPGRPSTLVMLRDFMQTGGRIALGLTFASSAIFGGRVIAQKMIHSATLLRGQRNPHEAL